VVSSPCHALRPVPQGQAVPQAQGSCHWDLPAAGAISRQLYSRLTEWSHLCPRWVCQLSELAPQALPRHPAAATLSIPG
jgi:hypothetical protein